MYAFLFPWCRVSVQSDKVPLTKRQMHTTYICHLFGIHKLLDRFATFFYSLLWRIFILATLTQFGSYQFICINKQIYGRRETTCTWSGSPFLYYSSVYFGALFLQASATVVIILSSAQMLFQLN